jgi:hypothetical protein
MPEIAHPGLHMDLNRTDRAHSEPISNWTAREWTRAIDAGPALRAIQLAEPQIGQASEDDHLLQCAGVSAGLTQVSDRAEEGEEMKWWTDKKWQYDSLVDELIAKNTARPRPGMDKPDLAILARVSQARWDETVKAQGRQEDEARLTSR